MVQKSLWTGQPGAFHYSLGREQAVLRDEGVLILGSGNIVHNLRTIDFHSVGYNWAQRIHRAARRHLLAGTHAALIEPAQLDPLGEPLKVGRAAETKKRSASRGCGAPGLQW